MQTSSIIAIGTAIAGFAMGWILKPTSESNVATSTATQPPPRERPNHSELVAPKRNSEPKQEINLTPSPSLGTEPLALRREQAFGQVSGRREKARLARFAEALGLEVDQIEAIAALIAKHKGSTNASPNALLTEAADGDIEFEDALLALLDDDQKERLKTFKTRTTENKIEANSMQDLAKVMKSVDLSSTQRENILNTFREKNRSSYTTEPDSWSLLNDSGSRLGYGNSDFNRYRDIFTDPSIADDPKKLADRIAEEEKLKTEEDLGIISGELTEQQLAELRASMEEKSISLFGQSIRDPRFR